MLRKEIRTCGYCQKKLDEESRSNQKFCSNKCKNTYNNAKNKAIREITKPVDDILHHNRTVLDRLLGKLTKRGLEEQVMSRAGFDFRYFTGIYKSQKGLEYFVCYDYAYFFKDDKVWIVKDLNYSANF